MPGELASFVCMEALENSIDDYLGFADVSMSAVY
jgi:hypothetical protein